MGKPERALGERIRELRRRQFGPRGKSEFARRLGVPVAEYERYERGVLPAAETMVRMCEVTGEDLQWLLTGVAARSTVVISGTRHRHQALLTKLATMLDEEPTLASPLEAFVDLLTEGRRVQQDTTPALPCTVAGELIAIYAVDEVPDALPAPDSGPDGGPGRLPVLVDDGAVTARETMVLSVPATRDGGQATRTLDIVTIRCSDGQTRRFAHGPELARALPTAFGVRLADDTMQPMFEAGDIVVVAAGGGPHVGRPALLKLAGEEAARCRIWLGESEAEVRLGCLATWEDERADRSQLRWALEVLCRLSPAA
ncbi:MAG: helix-turn-helix domain-containing protein [Planctomycetes bacterium]|nr:helix-turn-helix domain-containing protein [Planctomycetota bacterium]